MLCVIFLAVVFIVKTGCSQSSKDWGESSCGVQLSISLNTNVVTTNSKATFYIRIKNSSAGSIKLNIGEETPYIITNGLGKAYQIREGIAEAYPKFNPTINIGETKELPVPIIFGKDIEPGDYVFSPITRDITTADKNVCTLTSNPLNVKVVK